MSGILAQINAYSADLTATWTALSPKILHALSKLDVLAKQDFINLSTNARIAIYASVGWLALVRLLRYQRRNQKQRQYAYKTHADMKNMTATHAFEIQKYLYDVEFPFTTQKALEFALFR